ncbi:MAG: adenylate/guanylate cyclase domain-containing protein [Gammaproteobacteria bacterium]|nr:adenylate/guanylate cyclase domain-containing protein [Gammaproteobacteria bacterium]
MENKKAITNLKTKDFYKMLLRVNQDIARAATLKDALTTLVDLTISALGCESGSIFLYDKFSDELYSFIAHGNLRHEIRILKNKGLVGWAFSHDEAIMVADAYQDERFNSSIDQQTGFKTRNVLCVPLKDINGDLIGVSQMLNKIAGDFNDIDIELVRAMTEQAALAIQSKLIIDHIEASNKKDLEFLDAMSKISSEIHLSLLLEKTINIITKILDAERSTLFINDPRTNELYTEVGEGLGKTPIRFPNHLGIAGSAFTFGKVINIPHAYADLRFNPSFDKTTGFFTRSILTVPVRNKAGVVIGVTQVLNKKRGEFTLDDESQLTAINSQISMAIENARLFDDVQNMKNYNESVLESMSNGVITVNEENHIVTCNSAGQRILNLSHVSMIVGKEASQFFTEENAWLAEKITRIHDATDLLEQEILIDVILKFGDKKISTNITLLPLVNTKQERLGSMILIEDISSEKRMKSTMSRYMSPDLAEQLLLSGESSLGGTSNVATVLFSDIRNFTTITESLGPEGTVQLLNEYFTQMVDCIQNEGGMLDKFIGDAIMAVFGIPFVHPDDPDRSLRSAIAMMKALKVFNKKRAENGLMQVDHGIGINTDTIVSGNIGSEKRMDYTVIGDGVNLASRIESLCKQYGSHILISEFTLRALKATYRTRQVDKVIVKGKGVPVAIHEVIDFYDSTEFPNQIEVLNHFNNGIEYYNVADWDKAIASFQLALKLYPKDKPSLVYIERCQLLKKNPPTEWSGVWVMSHK